MVNFQANYKYDHYNNNLTAHLLNLLTGSVVLYFVNYSFFRNDNINMSVMGFHWHLLNDLAFK